MRRRTGDIRLVLRIEDGVEDSSLVEGQKVTRRLPSGVDMLSSCVLVAPGEPGERLSGETGASVAFGERLSSNEAELFTVVLFGADSFFAGLKPAREARAKADANSDEFTVSCAELLVMTSGLSTFRFLVGVVGTLELSPARFSISAD